MLTFMANNIDVSSRRFMFLYCFMFYGSVTLCYIMCYEGNYIDLLMMHKEEINSLLCAKYYFYNILLLIPFALLLPTLFMGTSTLLELLAYLIFTARSDTLHTLSACCVQQTNYAPEREVNGKERLIGPIHQSRHRHGRVCHSRHHHSSALSLY